MKTDGIRLGMVVVGTLMMLVVLMGCPDMFTADLDSPMDPEADGYQGFETTDDMNDVELHSNSDDGIVFLGSFILTQVNGATRYGIQIATAASFAADTVVYERRDFTSNTILATPDLNAGTTYYWRGQARKGSWGDYSDPASFSMTAVPWSNLSPADGSTVAETTSTLSWDAIDGAASYEVQIADTETGVTDGTTIEVTEAEYTNMMGYGTQYWRVRGIDENGGATTWSSTVAINVNWNLSPADESTVSDTTPTLSWDAVDGAAKYEVQVADSDSEVAEATAIEVTEEEYTPEEALENNATHYWRVRAVDAAGQATAWSSTMELTVSWGVMTGLSPADGNTVSDTTPTLSWDTVDGAVSYEVQIAGSATQVADATENDATSTEYSYSTELSDGNTLYWRVRALDDAGGTTSWSSTSSLTFEQFDLSVRDGKFTYQSVIPTGETATFNMGQPDPDIDGIGWNDDEQPVHAVTLTRPYAINTYEITNDQYAAVMNEALDNGWVTVSPSTVQNVAGDQQELLEVNSSYSRISYDGSDLTVESGYGDHPVVEVSWYGAVAFAYYLNELEGKEQTYDLSDWNMDADAAGYRLPTEAEWEYAARGGADSNGYIYAGSDDADTVAWYYSNSGSSTHTVGTKAANEIGTYDMSGNVREWVHDWYDGSYYSSSPESDPEGPASGYYCVERGGSWRQSASLVRTTRRINGKYRGGRSFYQGFRLVVSSSE